MMYLLHKILSETQQFPKYASSGPRVKFYQQYKCFNPTTLRPHPSTPTLVLYTSDRSKAVVLAVRDVVEKNIYVPF